MANKERTTWSLNLAQRERERASIEQGNLSDLNEYRATLGLAPVTIETRADNPLPGEDEHWNEVLHEEAARVLLDKTNWTRNLLTQANADWFFAA